MPSKLQGADIKNSTEIVAAGATIAQLPTDDQIYVSAGSINKTLKQAIVDGDIGSSAAKPKILVYSTSSQSVPSTTLTNITFDNINTDPNYSNNTSWFNTSTYRYTPQIAGMYNVNIGCFLIGTNNRSLVSLDLNSTNLVHGGSGGVSGDVGMDVSFNVYLNGTTDYISASAYTYGATVTTSNSTWETYFQAMWIGQ